MNNPQIIQTICGALFGLLVFSAFSLMFGRAVWKGDLIFHGGRIRGKLARILGVIGLLGIISGAYLAVSNLVFNTQPPFASIASLLFILFVVVLLGVRFLSIFFWHSE